MQPPCQQKGALRHSCFRVQAAGTSSRGRSGIVVEWIRGTPKNGSSSVAVGLCGLASSLTFAWLLRQTASRFRNLPLMGAGASRRLHCGPGLQPAEQLLRTRPQAGFSNDLVTGQSVLSSGDCRRHFHWRSGNPVNLCTVQVAHNTTLGH